MLELIITVHPSTRAQAENKKKVFALLGGKCCWRDENGGTCCWGSLGLPCDDPHALVIDHVQAGGETERRKGYSSGNAFYVRVRKRLEALPPGTKFDKYQLLCTNHNMIKRFDGLGTRTRSSTCGRWTAEQVIAMPYRHCGAINRLAWIIHDFAGEKRKDALKD